MMLLQGSLASMSLVAATNGQPVFWRSALVVLVCIVFWLCECFSLIGSRVGVIEYKEKELHVGKKSGIRVGTHNRDRDGDSDLDDSDGF
jgi:hypothetical protein